MPSDVRHREAKSKQQEGVGGVARCGPASHLGYTSVAGFDPKPATAQAPYLTRRRVCVDQNEDQPRGTSFHPSGPLRGDESSSDRQVSYEGLCLDLLSLREFLEIPKLAVIPTCYTND
jgi:hypothetical protein